MLLQNHGNPTGHKPELVLNNFTTRLGHRVGRLNFLQLLIFYCNFQVDHKSAHGYYSGYIVFSWIVG